MAPDDAAPRDRPTARDVLAAHLADLVTRAALAEGAVRAGEEDGVHALRVTTRRLRSVLRSAGPLVDRAATRPLRDELRWLATALGVARDAQVVRDAVAERLPEAMDDGVPGEPGDRAGPSGAVAAVLAQAHRSALGAVLETVRSPRYAALRRALGSLAADPPLTAHADVPARPALRQQVARARRRVRRALRAAGHEPPGPTRDTALHEVRKDAKAARYLAEAAAAVFPRRAPVLAEAMTRLQDDLGAHRDAALVRDRVRALATSAGPDQAWALGRFDAHEERRVAGGPDPLAVARQIVRSRAARRWPR